MGRVGVQEHAEQGPAGGVLARPRLLHRLVHVDVRHPEAAFPLALGAGSLAARVLTSIARAQKF